MCVQYMCFHFDDGKFSPNKHATGQHWRGAAAAFGIDMDRAWRCGNKDNGVILRDPAARLNHSAPRAAE
jgi:hypothetical protein